MIDEGRLPPRFHIVLDEAYVCTDQELSPWRGKNLPPEKDAFNYMLSKQRQCIERAFGILVKRWGIFWKALTIKLSNIPMVIRTACKLHNFIIDKYGEQNEEAIETYEHAESLAETKVFSVAKGCDTQLNSFHTNPIYTDGTTLTQGHRSDKVVCKTRDDITKYLLNKGIFREHIGIERMINGRSRNKRTKEMLKLIN
jgi:hypothetical protein